MRGVARHGRTDCRGDDTRDRRGTRRSGHYSDVLASGHTGAQNDTGVEASRSGAGVVQARGYAGVAKRPGDPFDGGTAIATGPCIWVDGVDVSADRPVAADLHTRGGGLGRGQLEPARLAVGRKQGLAATEGYRLDHEDELVD